MNTWVDLIGYFFYLNELIGDFFDLPIELICDPTDLVLFSNAWKLRRFTLSNLS